LHESMPAPAEPAPPEPDRTWPPLSADRRLTSELQLVLTSPWPAGLLSLE